MFFICVYTWDFFMGVYNQIDGKFGVCFSACHIFRVSYIIICDYMPYSTYLLRRERNQQTLKKSILKYNYNNEAGDYTTFVWATCILSFGKFTNIVGRNGQILQCNKSWFVTILNAFILVFRSESALCCLGGRTGCSQEQKIIIKINKQIKQNIACCRMTFFYVNRALVFVCTVWFMKCFPNGCNMWTFVRTLTFGCNNVLLRVTWREPVANVSNVLCRLGSCYNMYKNRN